MDGCRQGKPEELTSMVQMLCRGRNICLDHDSVRVFPQKSRDYE